MSEPRKWTQREEMHLDYGGDVNGRRGKSHTEYSVRMGGILTDIVRQTSTDDGKVTRDILCCRGNVFDHMDPENRGKLPAWLERMYQGEDNPPRLIEQPAGDIPMDRGGPA